MSLLGFLLLLSARPTAASDLGTVASIAVGTIQTCALTTAGKPHCWGANQVGSVGDGTTTDRPAPTAVLGLASGVASLSAGGGQTCAIRTTSGALKCWGVKFYGQLGDGTATVRTSPADVRGVASGVTSVNAGYTHTCAVTPSGTVKCVGTNSKGELGDGTREQRNVPVTVSGLTGVVAVTAGSSVSCALTAAGAVKCWGRGPYVGDGVLSVEDRLTPVDVVGLGSDVKAIASGYLHTCALLASGKIRCWGSTLLSGGLGDGNPRTLALSPVEVVGLSDAIAIGAGRDHTCAVTASGGLKCWGNNQYGQLGDGTNEDRPVPVDVVGLTSGVSAVDGGAEHTCALVRGGVKCWGSNERGRAGIGVAESRVPKDVPGFGATCGNGVLDPGEGCDDGDALDTGCCSSSCQLRNAAADSDADGICNGADNCPQDFNPDQRNSDAAGRGDVCDACAADASNGCDAQKSKAATVSSNGGTLTVPDASLDLVVSPATLRAPTSVSVTGGLSSSGYGLKTSDKTPLLAEFEPSGVIFDPPVTVTFRWTDRNDNCFVDDPTKTCPTTTRPPGVLCGDEPASCDLSLRETQLQIWRDGREFPAPRVYCENDLIGAPSKPLGCDIKANTWTIAAREFSEYVLGEATCSALGNADLEVMNLTTAAGDEKVKFRGSFNVDVPMIPALDPREGGFSVVVETASGNVVFAQQVEGGVFSTVTRTGWKKNPERDTWTYKGKPPGVKTAKVSVLSAAEGKVKVTLLARGLELSALNAGDLPLKLRLFVDGRCGDASYPGPAPAPRCRFNPEQSRVICD